MARKIPDVLLSRAAELIKAGAKLKDAASTIGCNPDDVSRRLREIGIKTDGRMDWAALTPTIISLYQQGLGTTAIAKHLNAPRHAASNVRVVLMQAGIMRGRSAACVMRASRQTAVEKQANTQKARRVRRRNMVDAANDRKALHGIGFGEKQVLQILTDAKLPVEPQKIVADNYLIDMALWNMAVEVKISALAAHISKTNRARCEKLVECGYKIVFVVANHIPIILRHANDLVAALNFIKTQPAAPGQYWVIRCTLEQSGADLEVDHWSIERRSPKTNGNIA